MRIFNLCFISLFFLCSKVYACSSTSYGSQLHSIENEFKSRFKYFSGIGSREAEQIKHFARQVYELSNECYRKTNDTYLENKYLDMRRYASGLYESSNDFINGRQGAKKSFIDGVQKYSKDNENFGFLDFALAYGGVVSNDEVAENAKKRMFYYLEQMEKISKLF